MASTSKKSRKRSIRPTDSNFEEVALQWLDESSYAGSESSEESDYGEDQSVTVDINNGTVPDYIPFSDSEGEDDNYETVPGESDADDNDEEEVCSNSNIMIAPNRKQWSTDPTRRPAKYCPHNIIRFTPGVRNKGTTLTPLDGWKKFVTPEMVNEIIQCTNREAYRVCSLKNKNWQPILEDEMQAFFGILLMSGAEKSWDVPVRVLFLDKMSNPIYRACMSANRFEDIKRFLRFDDKRTRDERLQTDKLAPISYIWNLFIKQCKTVLVPKINVTVDEQLLGYRGRCGFIQYMPQKPAKYGIKFFWLCESETGYAINGLIYVGRQPGEQVQRNLGANVVHTLIKPLQNSSRNLTVDNFFTNVDLFEALLNIKITAVGTIRKNKRDIPKQMQANKERKLYSSIFGFSQVLTLVSYVNKKNKAVMLLSSLHNNKKVDDTPKQKPEIIHYYNKTKGGVDIMDQKIENYTCKRQTKRWPFAIFSNILDVAALNAFIVFLSENKEYKRGRNDKRRLYLKELAKELILPYMRRRSKNVKLQKTIFEDMVKFITIEKEEQPAKTKIVTKKRCYMCPTKKDRKCDRVCCGCNKPICKEHTTYMCKQCK